MQNSLFGWVIFGLAALARLIFTLSYWCKTQKKEEDFTDFIIPATVRVAIFDTIGIVLSALWFIAAQFVWFKIGSAGTGCITN